MEPRIATDRRRSRRLVRPRIVAPGHCTGWRAKAALADRFAPGDTARRWSARPTSCERSDVRPAVARGRPSHSTSGLARAPVSRGDCGHGDPSSGHLCPRHPDPSPPRIRRSSRRRHAGRGRGSSSTLGEPHVAAGGNNIVIGFGADLWRRLSASPPADLGTFEPIDGLDGHSAPSTQHDIWVWIHGTGADVVLDTATAVCAVLAPVADLVDETECFVYHDSRDLTGFIDGTENPGPSDAARVASIADGRPGAGGSHVIAQRWVHDLDSFNDLEVDQQQEVSGEPSPTASRCRGPSDRLTHTSSRRAARRRRRGAPDLSPERSVRKCSRAGAVLPRVQLRA